jgi:hypothetical protein
MSDNLALWDKVARPPKEALKSIGGGRLKGMTDIKPQWRYKAMTEQFGVCGIGWKYVIVKEWTELGSDEQVVAFTNIDLFVKDGDKWSDAIPGTGGSMLVEKETRGLHTSDEAYKMALTDALSVAMAKLGIAASIYMGEWDGSKYKTQPKEQKKKEELPFVERVAKAKDIVGEMYVFDCLSSYQYDKAENVKPEDQAAIMADLLKQAAKGKTANSQSNRN